LDERLGLEKLIEEHLSDSREGLNKQFTLADLLRQSVQAGLVRRAKTSCRNPAISLGPALVANSLCSGQEKHTMRESDGQIGNSGFRPTKSQNHR
jgi:hypothetical protein